MPQMPKHFAPLTCRRRGMRRQGSRLEQVTHQLTNMPDLATCESEVNDFASDTHCSKCYCKAPG